MIIQHHIYFTRTVVYLLFAVICLFTSSSFLLNVEARQGLESDCITAINIF